MGCVSALGHFCKHDLKNITQERKRWHRELPELLERMHNHKQDPVPQLETFLHERDVALPVRNLRWDLLGPVGPRCFDLEKYGVSHGATKSGSSIFDTERKMACGLTRAGPNCTVVSIGSNDQWSFEEDVVRHTQCRIHVFDCTVRPSVRVPPAISHRVVLHRFCIGTPPPPDRRQVLVVPNEVWSKRRWETSTTADAFRSYEELLQVAHLRSPPTLLKMDAEGFEWSALAMILGSDGRNAPEQLAVELHFQTQFPALSWFGRLKSPAEILALGDSLVRAGYYLVSREDNRACKWCTEVLYVRRLHLLPPPSRTPLDVRRSRSGLPNRCAMDAEETDREAVTAKMGAEGGKVDDFLFEIA